MHHIMSCCLIVRPLPFSGRNERGNRGVSRADIAEPGEEAVPGQTPISALFFTPWTSDCPLDAYQGASYLGGSLLRGLSDPLLPILGIPSAHFNVGRAVFDFGAPLHRECSARSTPLQTPDDPSAQSQPAAL